jgi:hypothetical protein
MPDAIDVARETAMPLKPERENTAMPTKDAARSGGAHGELSAKELDAVSGGTAATTTTATTVTLKKLPGKKKPPTLT